MNQKHRQERAPDEQTAFLLDDAWPEYRSFVAACFRPTDQIVAPGLHGKARISRYDWHPDTLHAAPWATAQRHIGMRRVARAPGGVRQATYLRHDAAVAAALAKHLDFRAQHLVIAQSWLPHLAALGVLGGRSFDVLMHRYPMHYVHATLDAIHGDSIHGGPGKANNARDFRAPDAVSEIEQRALAAARHIITPHHGIAALFPDQALLLNWHAGLDESKGAANAGAPGTRTAFLGPTIARERPDIVRRMAHTLDAPLILFGQNYEAADFWDGIAIEPRTFSADWLRDISTIWHPAPMVSQPRRLLQAIAAGVTVHATMGCGLAPDQYQLID